MLKYFFWIALFTNVGLFAFHSGYLDGVIFNGKEPERLKQQLHAEKMKWASAPPLAVAIAPPATLACLEIGNFTSAHATIFGDKLIAASLGNYQSRYTVQEATYYRVVIPPQKNKEAARKKGAELQKLGVKDFFVIEEGSHLDWGISLGVFKTRTSAEKKLSQLVGQGVHSAKVVERSNTNNQVAFQLRNVPVNMHSSIEKIKADFPDQEERECSSI